MKCHLENLSCQFGTIMNYPMLSETKTISRIKFVNLSSSLERITPYGGIYAQLTSVCHLIWQLPNSVDVLLMYKLIITTILIFFYASSNIFLSIVSCSHSSHLSRYQHWGRLKKNTFFFVFIGRKKMRETVVISFVKIVWGFMRLTVSCFIDSFFSLFSISISPLYTPDVSYVSRS